MYQFNPGCCCGGCDFFDDFSSVFPGYSDQAHSSAPVFSVSGGVLSLTGGEGSHYRTVHFDADANAGGLALTAVLAVADGMTGVFVGNIWAFLADWYGGRFMAYECDSTGAETGSTVVISSRSPVVGDRLEMRVAWSALTPTWRVQFYVNGELQPNQEAVTFTGQVHHFGVVGTRDGAWASYQQDCNATLTSAVFCSESVAGQVQQFSGDGTDFSWASISSAIGNQDGVGATVTMTSGPVARNSQWLSGSAYGFAIPTDATIVSILGWVIYKTSFFIVTVNDSLFQQHNDATLIGQQRRSNLPFSNNTFVSISPGQFAGPFPDIDVINSLSYGLAFSLRYRPPNPTFTYHVDSMHLKICYRLDF